jgi:hypothetical protein
MYLSSKGKARMDDFADYLHPYGLTIDHARALLERHGLDATAPDIAAQFFTCMGMKPDTLQEWVVWRAANDAAVAQQQAAWSAIPFSVAMGGYRPCPGVPMPKALELVYPNTDDAATVFADKICRPSHRAWAKRCTHWKCN